MRVIDFVVPLRSCTVIAKTVLEGITNLYLPRRIIIIAPRETIIVLQEHATSWKVAPLVFINEEEYFLPNFNMTLEALYTHYSGCEAKVFSDVSGEELQGGAREVGWWLQQLIKLGACSQIPDLSKNYIVWDGDLIPLKKWELFSTDGKITYNCAILQSAPKSEFNTQQYLVCNKDVSGLDNHEPEGGGTSVAHHMCFNTKYVKTMLKQIEERAGGNTPWPIVIMSKSQQYYRFSEYKLYFSWLATHHPEALKYHPLADFGQGERYREADDKVAELLQAIPNSTHDGISYKAFMKYAQQSKVEHSYMQMDKITTPLTSKIKRLPNNKEIDDSKVAKVPSNTDEEEQGGPLKLETIAMTTLTLALVSLEMFYRYLRCHDLTELINIWSISAMLCVLMVFTGIKNSKWAMNSFVPCLKMLHASDSVFALVIGVSIAYNIPVLFIAAVIGIHKFYLLHVLSRMVTGTHSLSEISVAVQTLKTFFHHSGSFLFVRHPAVAVITGIWRFISMNAQTALTLREYLGDEAYLHLTLWIAYSRYVAMMAILYFLHFHELSSAFAVSGIGHFAYVAIRLESVFRLAGGAGAGGGAVIGRGSIYLSYKDYLKWIKMSIFERLVSLFALNHLMLGLEVLLLSWLCVAFLYLRGVAFIADEPVCHTAGSMVLGAW